MRLIDADRLYKKVKTECNPYGKPSISYEDGLIVLDLIEHEPAVEPVIIRCKDCKHSEH